MVNLSPLQEFRSTSPFSQTWKRSAEKLWIIRASLVLRKELQKIGVGDIGSRSHQPTASPCTHLQLCYLAFASCPNFLLEKQREVYSLSVLVVSAFLNWNKQKKSNSIKRKKINSIAIATEPPPPPPINTESPLWPCDSPQLRRVLFITGTLGAEGRTRAQRLPRGAAPPARSVTTEPHGQVHLQGEDTLPRTRKKKSGSASPCPPRDCRASAGFGSPGVMLGKGRFVTWI